MGAERAAGLKDGITIGRRGPALKISDPSGEPLLEEVVDGGVPSVGVTEVRLKWWVLISWWQFRRKLKPWRWAYAVLGESGEGRTVLGGDDGSPLLETRESAVEPHVVEGEVSTVPGVTAD